MRRTVTIEIDQKAFSKAFRSMTGEEAKEVLVMLVCGGHSVSSHSACLLDVGIRPAPPAPRPGAEQAVIDSKIARAAESFIDEASPILPSEIMKGIADRPKPGDKKRAREAFMGLLGSIHELRAAIAYARPLKLVGSSKGGAEACPEADQDTACRDPRIA